MPISKRGKLYFTNAQYKAARQCSALKYAVATLYDLVKEGRAYHLRQHDSMIFTQDGRWFWNSRGLKGRALEFIQHYEGRSLPEAVILLTEAVPLPYLEPCEPTCPLVRKPFELPEKSPTFKRLFAYLCKIRKLDVKIVQMLIQQGRLYEGVHYYTAASTGELRAAHNAVFVALDEMGRPRGAFQRGTNTFAFKGDVEGSEKKYAFCCPGREGVTKLSVFEAAIDAISHATLAKRAGEDWASRDRIALDGKESDPLLFYLERYPQYKEIELCLDQDAYGKTATVRLLQALRDAGYTKDNGYSVYASTRLLTGKDWNDELMALCARQA